MKTLLPALTKMTVLLAAVFATVTGYAQTEAYASLDKKSGSVEYSSTRKNAVEPFIKVKGRMQTKVVLNWAPVPGAVSHYVLERSADGRLFREAGVLFTGDREEEPEYFFTDNFKKAYNGPLYYRLRIVGLEGSEIYTPVTTLKPVAE